MRLQPPVFMIFPLPHTVQIIHSVFVPHSLAHSVGQTVSMDPSNVCCWVCVYELQLVLSGLFTPPGGHSLYHILNCLKAFRMVQLPTRDGIKIV